MIVNIKENANLIILEMRIKPIINPMAITTSLVMMQLSSQQMPVRTVIQTISLITDATRERKAG